MLSTWMTTHVLPSGVGHACDVLQDHSLVRNNAPVSRSPPRRFLVHGRGSKNASHSSSPPSTVPVHCAVFRDRRLRSSLRFDFTGLIDHVPVVRCMRRRSRGELDGFVIPSVWGTARLTALGAKSTAAAAELVWTSSSKQFYGFRVSYRVRDFAPALE